MKRRQFLARCLVSLAGCARYVAYPGLVGLAARAQAASARERLERSLFVYVSPLRSDGGESSCHAEVWYAWLDDAVVMIVSTDRWKARAVRRGLDKARVWVGDHGRWKGLISNNERFRSAPSFVASAERVEDAACSIACSRPTRRSTPTRSNVGAIGCGEAMPTARAS